ncbi:tRNA (adenosine(37)-N6)-threonylcarbamoyltransferase complex dimerization subunit type 1 TsaB [Candidatus Curtissbacteria bacterium RIFCSPLOWO2_02_FULL_40_11]|uniref:tRNA (Adenosine(37)-N6)-threonylcarbamoyltransferase complex dimerization subunit type 1 TsaB n=1 Tax=Candidatus Curtissbacteria bacterium RIFCSPHIGHO2_02_FULL_40_16b TaxID=1797714 RepID=A0A1F5GBZ9_9BACT|nr:MAG: tRNA (adenosine(37)-N6)-threonylcarbamoyltransferase complex dimerization subunit type 1 TsaB [Candidatus Curtissbacteria bacterium RIFCSPHIGHO2_02_FULL_40_16b]OGE01052.1 MAG: tRNA (adenosine(37)-N6)-threonylcarbamoyltransferase complex dimerization subunit type 1 TsaB [Candidatus Curtissbacteria bacterium RIFCSPLOWO2_02_FULL_40_11]
MKLKIESTNPKKISVKLFKGNKKLGYLSKNQKVGSQVLLPMIIKVLKQNEIKFSDVTSIEVDTGPGSFTGTRVGVAIANALGYALKIPVNGKKGKIALPRYAKSKFD